MADDAQKPLANPTSEVGQSAPPPQPASISKPAEFEPPAAKPPEIKANMHPEKPLSPEVAEYIKHHDEKVKIPEALKQIGIEADAKDQTIEEVVEGPKLPLSDQQIADGLKQPMSMSVRWLSLFLLYILQQAHYTIKTVKGHVTRIVKP